MSNLSQSFIYLMNMEIYTFVIRLKRGFVEDRIKLSGTARVKSLSSLMEMAGFLCLSKGRVIGLTRISRSGINLLGGYSISDWSEAIGWE